MLLSDFLFPKSNTTSDWLKPEVVLLSDVPKFRKKVDDKTKNILSNGWLVGTQFIYIVLL